MPANRLIRLPAALLAVICVTAHGVVRAQTTATTATTTTGTTTTATTTTGTTGNITNAAGIVIDPNGVLRTQIFMDQAGQLMWRRNAAAFAAANPKAAKVSKLRKVSLNRLEAAVKKRTDEGQQLTDEMKSLAGLTRIQYLFYYPDTKDIVIAGPAEGWAPDLSGRIRGLTSGRPVVQLDDLVSALRAFPPGGKATSIISCSIDPTQEGLQRMQEFLRQIGSRATPGDTETIVTGLKQSLGLEKVTIKGVPANTHFAQILVEADYRMKLIGIGLETPPIKQLVSYIERAKPSSVSKNALERWFFVPDYECLRVTEDDSALELIGDGVKLVNADEVVAADGSRAKSGTIDAASRDFTQNFTKKYPELAAVSPVYSQLRNCIDLAMLAAFMQQKDYYAKAGWEMPLFGSETAYPVRTLSAPQQVETAVASVWKGNHLMTPIGGGVEIRATKALARENAQGDSEGKVAAERDKVDLKGLAKDQWWWD
jgi:hypothetical protein